MICTQPAPRGLLRDFVLVYRGRRLGVMDIFYAEGRRKYVPMDSDKIADVRALMLETTEYVREGLLKIHTYALTQMYYALPYFRIDKLF